MNAANVLSSFRRSIVIGSAAILLLGCANEDYVGLTTGAYYGQSSYGASPKSYPVHGIDLSKYQGDVDWNTVRKSGIKFAYIKATEGGDRFDKRFNDNWRGAAKAGVARGAYHFYYFCRPAKDQVAWFIRHVPRDKNALPPVLDMEWNGHSPTCTKKPPRDKVLSEMRLFLKRLERHYKQKPVIYSSVDFHREILEGQFEDYPFWLRSVASHPREKYSNRDNWLFWQYTGTGRVKGIRGNVDKNVFSGSHRDWKKWLESVRG